MVVMVVCGSSACCGGLFSCGSNTYYTGVLIAASTVVTSGGCIYLCGGIVAGLWLDSCEQVYMWELLSSSIAANAYKLVSKCDCSKHRLHFVTN